MIESGNGVIIAGVGEHPKGFGSMKVNFPRKL